MYIWDILILNNYSWFTCNSEVTGHPVLWVATLCMVRAHGWCADGLSTISLSLYII